jgi:hypothetical protein
LICSELHECLGVGVRACAHELMFSLVSASCAHLLRNSSCCLHDNDEICHQTGTSATVSRRSGGRDGGSRGGVLLT